ncbi:protein MAK16A [Hordeum vulgare]|nr:protein MAK16A [Hordeum vulgare]
MQKSARVTESELKERLRKGVYGENYNFPFKQFDTILDMEKDELAPEIEEEEEGEIEYAKGDDIEMGDMDDMEDFEGFGDEDDDGDEDDMEEPVTKKPKRSDSDSSSTIGRKSRKVINEVEEDEDRGSKQRTQM